MANQTFDFSTKRILFQLDKMRGCHDCKDKKGCDRYTFVNDATSAIIEENGLEESFLGQVLARNLSWAIADEAFLGGRAIEGDDEIYYDEDVPPLFYILESLREHMRELAKLVLEMREQD